MPHTSPSCRASWVIRFVCCLPFLVTLTGCGGAPANSGAAPSGSTSAANKITGAVLGYAWDVTSQGLRAIQGVPGAAYLGSPIYGSGAYTSGVVSARSGYALLSDKGGGLWLGQLPSGQPTPLLPASSTSQHIVLSPTGSAAAAFADNNPQVFIFTQLPATPHSQQVSIPMSGHIAGLSVSDTGLLLVATGGSSAMEVSSVSATGVVRSVASLVGYGDMRFIASTSDALIADAGQNAVWWAKNVAAGSSLVKIASAADGVQTPVGIASSFDGRWAVIANQTGTVLRVDLKGQEPIQLAKSLCTPGAIVPLIGNTMFQITPQGTAPVWLYEGDLATPRAVFVPALNNAK